MSALTHVVKGSIVTGASLVPALLHTAVKAKPPVTLKLNAIASIIGYIAYAIINSLPHGNHAMQMEVYSLISACWIVPALSAFWDYGMSGALDPRTETGEFIWKKKHSNDTLQGKALFLVLTEVFAYFVLKYCENISFRNQPIFSTVSQL